MNNPNNVRLGIVSHILERRYRYLLYALLGFLVIPSFFFRSPYHREVTYLCLSAVLVMGVYAVHTTTRRLYAGLFAALIVITINSTGLFSNNATVQFYVGFLFYMVFYLYVAYELARMVIRTTEVTIGVLFASIIVYLLVGLIGGFCFMLIENAFPGSLKNLELTSLSTDPSHFIYFSFVTMTTLGYGDITPVSAPAESVAVLLSVFGPLYLTILIAMLVGRYIPHSPQAGTENRK